MSRIDEIKARLAASTSGPWSSCSAVGVGCPCGLVWGADQNTLVVVSPDHEMSDQIPSQEKISANTRLIANAPADLQWLLDVVERLSVRVEDAEDVIAAYKSDVEQGDEPTIPHDEVMRKFIGQ